MNVTQKIINSHIISGTMEMGQEISILIDQTLTQDTTGTMAYLQLEKLGIDKVKTKRSVAYIDHNMLQEGFENADDHAYIQSVASKYGIYYSKAGNGVCHQVNIERFSVPGQTLLGSDSHTPTAGGVGMLAIGAGGLDVALAMGGVAYSIVMPKVVNVKLTGSLAPFSSAKDIILELLRLLTVKGGVGKIFEYSGEGLKCLSVYERATIANMGAELGATTSVFPSDDVTKQFFNAQNREQDFDYLIADDNAKYDDVIEIDLSALKPLAACPHSPDNVCLTSELSDITVNQVLIGGCTNGSYSDFVKAAKILKGKTVHKDVSFGIAPGSRQTLMQLITDGYLNDLLGAGARLLEAGCGPCIGMGQAPMTNGVSLRTFNRNFLGRCGTKSASVYLVSPETAAASALTGKITDPSTLKADIDINYKYPEKFIINDDMIIPPAQDGSTVEIVRGPNIKPFPVAKPMEKEISAKALIILGDNITTDHIMPSNAKLLPFRSNVPYLSKYCLAPCDENFAERAERYNGGIIVAGENYGQGSSREHAALAPLYLGVKAVLAKSFARIHKANLINMGILPLVFAKPVDYDKIDVLDELFTYLNDFMDKKEVEILNKTKGISITATLDLSQWDKEILQAGGKLNYYKNRQ